VTLPLAGLVVVVTRPAAQASGFAELVSAAGAQALLLPTLEIETVALDADARHRLVPDAFDWTIYTSANAVDSSLRQLPRPQRTRVAAVGRATARALEQHGIAVAAVPGTTADSEGLLELECLADLRGRRVLILKGRGGRALLREELARRGAEVVLGDVYQRRRADATPEALAELCRACDADRAVIAATSAEVLTALLELAPAERCPRLRDAALLVPGERVAAAARGYGWRGRVVIAPGAEDAVMAEALGRAFAGECRPGAAC
jgi:uroporphyrinogen-III synthase